LFLFALAAFYSFCLFVLVAPSSNNQAPHKNPAHRGINKYKHYLFKGTFGLLKAKVARSKAALTAGIRIPFFVKVELLG
jgi:hypothetical protein